MRENPQASGSVSRFERGREVGGGGVRENPQVPSHVSSEGGKVVVEG